MNEYKSKGFMFFKLDNNYELVYQIITIDDMVKTVSPVFQEAIADIFIHPAYDLLSGKEFLDYVRNGCITDNDGILSGIYIDGFRTNLGLDEAGFSQGNFLVSDKVFEDLCNSHEVLVNWANK